MNINLWSQVPKSDWKSENRKVGNLDAIARSDILGNTALPNLAAV